MATNQGITLTSYEYQIPLGIPAQAAEQIGSEYLPVPALIAVPVGEEAENALPADWKHRYLR
jgi:hypothetical protein